MTKITVAADNRRERSEEAARVILRFENLKVDGRQRAVAMTIAALLLVMTLAALPRATQQAPALPGIVPTLLAAAIVADLVTAHLVIAQFAVSGCRALLLLASSFTFSALAMGTYLVTFPGLFPSARPLGGASAGAWLFLLWHAGFPVLVLAYVLTARRSSRVVAVRYRAPIALATQLATFAVVALVTAAALHLDRTLPLLLVDDGYGTILTSGVGPFVWCVALIVLGVLLRMTRGARTIDLWLAVTVLALSLDMGLTLISGRRYTLGWYTARANSLFSSVIVLSVFLYEVNKLYARASAMALELGKLAFRDGLTGLANKRALAEALAREWRLAAREHRSISLVMCDLDCFKEYNDRYGHQAGDECLQRVAAEVARCAGRSADLAARFGGEELAVLLPGTDVLGARDVAERIRRAVELLAIAHAGSPVAPYVTLSLGVASRVPGPAEDHETLVRAADEALYEAKRQGRNRVAPSRLRLALDPGQHPLRATATATPIRERVRA